MSSSQIQIDILSDVVCPWCVLGYQRLERAIETLGLQDRVTIHWHPFELNPNMPAAGENLREHLANKYGTTLNGSIEARKRLTELGSAVGFSFDYFDEMRMFNTRKAHLLLQWAQIQDRQTALAKALFAAYFGQRQDISDTERLLELVESVGLNPEQARVVLDSSEVRQELADTEQHWLTQGFNGVPVMIFQNQQLLTGAQEIETYIDVLKSCINITE